MVDAWEVRLTWSQAFLLDLGSLCSPLADREKNQSRTLNSSEWFRHGVQMIWSRPVIAIHARVRLLGGPVARRILQEIVRRQPGIESWWYTFQQGALHVINFPDLVTGVGSKCMSDTHEQIEKALWIRGEKLQNKGE